MAPVPVLAQCLAPGSVRYDPTNQPNNKKNQSQYTKARQRGKSLIICPIKTLFSQSH